jgi:predicted unusual protein kinase regulating ubiquinone biosynthesis (AarF/ABC1/UbiB family)
MSGVILTPSIRHLFDTVRAIRKRLLDPKLSSLSFPEIYQKLSDEFPSFSSEQPRMFVRLVETTKPETTPEERQKIFDRITSILYYRDKVMRGLMTEEEVADIVAGKFLTPELKAESDRRLKEMRNTKSKTEEISETTM